MMIHEDIQAEIAKLEEEIRQIREQANAEIIYRNGQIAVWKRLLALEHPDVAGGPFETPAGDTGGSGGG